MAEVRVGFLGAGFVAEIHAEAFRHVPEARLTAVYSQTAARAEAFAQRHGVPRWTDDWRAVVSAPDVDVVVVMLPNFRHAEVAVAAAEAGKHVIVEKPLCLTLEEADAMIAACKRSGVLLCYAEELCFAPKYERLRQLAQQGAFGRVYHLRQAEKHSGPHSEWFWDVRRSGGGALMDMGCHAFGWFRWMLGSAFRPVEVLCRLDRHVHTSRTQGEDHAVALVVFADGQGNVVTAQAEESWAKLGGMDDRAEVYGSGGVAYADLFQGSSALVYSESGYDYALEKAGGTRGWSFALAEEVYQQGYPHEMRHFVECIRTGQTPRCTGEDGRAVLEMLLASYRAAGTGTAVRLPYRPDPPVGLPVELWRPLSS